MRSNVLLRRLHHSCTRIAVVLWHGRGDGGGGAGAEGREAAAAEALASGDTVLVLAQGRGACGVEGGGRRGCDGAEQQARVLGHLDDEAVRGDGLEVFVEIHEKRDVRNAGAERVEFEAAAGGARTV